jgi:DNA-binding transcriptional ArsR family regulator
MEARIHGVLTPWNPRFTAFAEAQDAFAEAQERGGEAGISTGWLTVGALAATVNHVVDDQGAMDAVFHALASRARRDMVARLAGGPLTVGQLAQPLAMSLAAAAKHVQVLERAGLIRRTIDGRRHICRLEPGPLASAQAWLAFYERHWRERLDALENLFQTPDEKEQ